MVLFWKILVLFKIWVHWFMYMCLRREVTCMQARGVTYTAFRQIRRAVFC